MTNFDTDNLVNASLIQTALIRLRASGKIVSVTDMDKETITVVDSELKGQVITDDDWAPIFLDEAWLHRLNLDVDCKIRNVHTDKDWTIRRSGVYYYLTTDRDISLGENPVLPVHQVHELQAFYYRLTRRNLEYEL